MFEIPVFVGLRLITKSSTSSAFLAHLPLVFLTFSLLGDFSGEDPLVARLAAAGVVCLAFDFDLGFDLLFFLPFFSFAGAFGAGASFAAAGAYGAFVSGSFLARLLVLCSSGSSTSSLLRVFFSIFGTDLLFSFLFPALALTSFFSAALPFISAAIAALMALSSPLFLLLGLPLTTRRRLSVRSRSTSSFC